MVPLENTWIRTVVIYKGHTEHPKFGPYADHIPKQIAMFETLNVYRKQFGRSEWQVLPTSGEELIQTLEKQEAKTTLLVIPAGPSSHLEEVFSPEQVTFIRKQFLKQNGGKLFATCGSSYMMSKTREFFGYCPQNLKFRELWVKKSAFPLFKGVAKGPLCPFNAAKYNASFYSEAVQVAGREDTCTLYLSGGGSFFLKENDSKTQVALTYLNSELIRLGKTSPESKLYQNAAIMTQVGKGFAFLSMVHPYYGSRDFDPAACQKAFPNSGTDWQYIQDHLSPLDLRMRFVLRQMLFPLEDASFFSK